MTNRTLQSSVKEKKKIERGYRRRDRKMDFQIAKEFRGDTGEEIEKWIFK